MIRSYVCSILSHRGSGVRELSKKICSLLNDSRRLAQERKTARGNREKFTSLGTEFQSSGDPRSYDNWNPTSVRNRLLLNFGCVSPFECLLGVSPPFS